jgi:hypothetical protein
MRLLEFRMVCRKTRIICLQRGYLAPDEGNLTSHFRFVSAVVNHPVEVVKVFLECSHNVKSDLKNPAPSSTPLRDLIGF